MQLFPAGTKKIAGFLLQTEMACVMSANDVALLIAAVLLKPGKNTGWFAKPPEAKN